MRYLFPAFLALWSLFVHAAEWVEMASPSAAKLAFDRDGARRDGNIARAWDSAVWPVDQTEGSGDVAYRSVRTLMSYHCIRRTSVPLARIFFREDGIELMRVNLEGVELPQPVAPDSARARMLELACNAKPPPPAMAMAAAGSVAGQAAMAGAEPVKAKAKPKRKRAAQASRRRRRIQGIVQGPGGREIGGERPGEGQRQGPGGAEGQFRPRARAGTARGSALELCRRRRRRGQVGQAQSGFP